MTNPVEEFSALSKDLIDGKVSETDFQQALIDRLGYGVSEARTVVKNLRRTKRETMGIRSQETGSMFVCRGKLHDR